MRGAVKRSRRNGGTASDQGRRAPRQLQPRDRPCPRGRRSRPARPTRAWSRGRTAKRRSRAPRRARQLRRYRYSSDPAVHQSAAALLSSALAAGTGSGASHDAATPRGDPCRLSRPSRRARSILRAAYPGRSAHLNADSITAGQPRPSRPVAAAAHGSGRPAQPAMPPAKRQAPRSWPGSAVPGLRRLNWR